MATARGGFPAKTALAVLTVGVALTLWHWRVPAGGMNWSHYAELWRPAFLKKPVPPPPPPKVQTIVPKKMEGVPADALFVDNKGALDRFYSALAKVDSHTADAHVTVMHFGDSPTTADLITGDVRHELQQRFGDAGQGFNLIAKPWAWYQHFDIDETDKGWKWETAVGRMREGAYGTGGAWFDGSSGAESQFRLKGAGQNAVEVAYESRDIGGSIAIEAGTKEDNHNIAELNTATAPVGMRFERIALPAGTNFVRLLVAGGSVRVYGVIFERDAPGVIYDSLGLNGATTSVIARALNGDLMRQSFEHLAPSLVVINYGTNESSFGTYVNKQYEAELRVAITRVRQAAPGADILIMSPMDRGERVGGDAIQTMSTIPQIVAIQRRVAAETGCGFFDTFDAMGGDGTMQRWYEQKPRLVGGDLIHPSPQGAKIVATAFVKELLEGYARYRKRTGEPVTPQVGEQTAR